MATSNSTPIYTTLTDVTGPTNPLPKQSEFALSLKSRSPRVQLDIFWWGLALLLPCWDLGRAEDLKQGRLSHSPSSRSAAASNWRSSLPSCAITSGLFGSMQTYAVERTKPGAWCGAVLVVDIVGFTRGRMHDA